MHKKSLISSGIVALLAVAMVAASVGQEKITPVAEADSVTEVPVTEETSQETETVETPEEEAQGNLIVNGDFSDGTNHFNVYTNGGSYNMTRNSEGELQMDITNTGTVNYGVQLYYDGFQLDQGAEYEFSFDVRGSIPRDMEWRIQINGGDYHAYYAEVIDVTEETQHVVSRFTMEEASDPAPRLCFNMGASDAVAQDEAHSVMLDNLDLELVDDSNLVEQAAAVEAPKVKINQIGYHPSDKKVAVFSDLACSDGEISPVSNFQIVDSSTGETVYNGTISEGRLDTSTGEVNASGDFSDFTTPGTYKIVTADGEESFVFSIGEDLYQDTLEQVAKMFYLQRCGQELTEDEAGAFAHPACHDTLATIYGTDQKIDVSGGWLDAGDYGRYIVPAAKAVADLLLAYEKDPDAVKATDLLQEVKYETDWMLKMQDPLTGGVYHKVTCKAFPGTVLPQDETEELVVSPLSKVASIDFAASMALASRIYTENGDGAYGQICLDAAQKAWSYYLQNKTVRGFQNPSDITTGEYADGSSAQEYFWAAAELYKTTGNSEYKTHMAEALAETKEASENLGGLGWMDVAAYGAYAALTTPELLADSSGLLSEIQTAFFAAADEVVAIAMSNPYLVSRKNEFEWGSNMGIANNGMLLMLANEIAPNEEYVNCAKMQLNYLMGVNATGYCFVTGAGTLSPQNPHHRPSQVIGECMPGMLVGGPDSALEDPYAKAVLKDTPAAKCYADNAQSYSCNEVTIYWNSPLVYLLTANS